MNRLTKILPYLDQMLVSGSHFVIGILLARALGLESYGVFALIWMGVLFVSSIHQSLIIIPAMTFAGKKKEETYFTDLLNMQILFSVLAFVSIVVFMQIGKFFVPEWNEFYLLYLFPILTLFYLFHDFFRKQFYITSKVPNAFLLDLFAYVPQVLGMGTLFFLDKLSLDNAMALIMFSYFIASFFGLLLNKKPTLNYTTFKSTCKQHWDFSKWLTGKSLLQWFGGNIFIIAAGSILGTGAVGVIRMAQNVTGIINIFFLTLENSVPVQAAKIYNDIGFDGLQKYLKKITVRGTFILGFSILLLVFAAGPLIELLYGPQPSENIMVFRGFLIFTILVFWGIPLRFAIRTVEETKAIFIAYLLNAGIGILLAYPLINQFDIWGVLLGLVLTQVATHLWYIFTLKRIENAKNNPLCLGQSQP